MSSPGTPGKRAGMRRAQLHADPHWWQCMLECGRMVAEGKPRFNCDDIVELCRKRHPNASTPEHRAMGPLMKELARLGYCVKTLDWFESRQKVNHARDMRTWHSLIYRGPKLSRPRKRRRIDPRQIPLLLEEA
jgi:hypothetical protein